MWTRGQNNTVERGDTGDKITTTNTYGGGDDTTTLSADNVWKEKTIIEKICVVSLSLASFSWTFAVCLDGFEV